MLRVIYLLTELKRSVNFRTIAGLVLFVTCFAAAAEAQYTEKAIYPGAIGLDRHAVATASDQMYVIGGEIWNGTAFSVTNLVYRYDPVANTWTPRANLPVTLSNHEACAMNGKIYVPGGYNGTTSVGTLYIYDIAGNSWTTGAAAPAAPAVIWPVVACNAATNKLYVIGGFNLTAATAATQIYDATANSWSTGAPMPAIRYGADGGLINGVIYVTGGNDGTTTGTTTYAYNIAGNSWTTVAPIPLGCLYGASGVDKAGRLWIVGGGFCSDASAYTGRTAIYIPGSNTWASGPVLNEITRHTNGGFAGNSNSLFTITGGAIAAAPGVMANTQQAVGPTASGVSISGRVIADDGRGVTNARVTLTDSSGNVFTAVTGRMGRFTIDDVPSGTSYVATVISRRYSFGTRVIDVTDNITDLDFMPSGGAGRGNMKDDIRSEP